MDRLLWMAYLRSLALATEVTQEYLPCSNMLAYHG